MAGDGQGSQTGSQDAHRAVLTELRAVLGPQPDGHLAPDVGEQPGQGEGVDADQTLV